MKVHGQSYRATKKPGEVIKYFLYSVVAVLLAADVMASDVSKDDILEFIDKVDSSFIINRNPEALESTLSENVTLTGTTSVSGNISEYSASKEQYLSSAIGAWKNYRDYKYTKERSEIISITENTAIVDEVVTETFRVEGTSYQVRSKNKVFLEKRKETLKATKIITNSTVTKI